VSVFGQWELEKQQQAQRHGQHTGVATQAIGTHDLESASNVTLGEASQALSVHLARSRRVAREGASNEHVEARHLCARRGASSEANTWGCGTSTMTVQQRDSVDV
jgi:hypothetical protein